MANNAKKENLIKVAEKLGYVAGYGNNYIETYGNLGDNEAAYFLQNLKGVKGSIAWKEQLGFFAHWKDEKTGKKSYSPYFQDVKNFFDFVQSIPELIPN